MKTTLRYLRDHARETTAMVMSVNPVGEFEDDDRASVVLSETIMQHETHDRVGDRGWIEDEPVVAVTRSCLGDVLHHFWGPEGRFRVGQRVRVQLDLQQRDLQARLLCAGRLIELVGPHVFPDLEPITADYRPNRAKVEFVAPEFIPEPETVWPDFCREVERTISLDLPVKTTAIEHCPFRYVQIGDLPQIKCSGVYPRSLKMIRKLTITKIVVVGGRLQVRYRVDDIVQ